MKKNFLFVLVLVLIPLLLGCKKGRNETVDADFNIEMASHSGDPFDSLMWLQYHCPEEEEKTVYEWNWAYDVREVLGIEDLDSLTILSRKEDDSYQDLSDSGIPFQMNTASNVYAGTARFCMLNVYQALAELVCETPLGENDNYYHDYVLWEELFKEFDAWYVNGGSGRGYEVDYYYTQLAEFRTESLLEELAFFSEDETNRKLYANARHPRMDKQWMKTHPAIQNWYNHRMEMANKIQRHNPSWAQCIRALTYKQVDLYIRFETKTEKEYNFDDE